jgi:transcriptional regulator with XRE-family HTH domain
MEQNNSPTTDSHDLGKRVRDLRQKRRYALQDLAAKTGLPKPLLEQLENDQHNPPVASLFKIAKALDVDISYFFQTDDQEVKVAVTHPEQRITSVKRGHQQAGEVGYSYQSLEVHKPHKLMQPLLVSFDVMEKSEMVFVCHEGQECVYLLSGELEFRTPEEVHHLRQGDCLYFDSDVPHAFRSLGDEPAEALIVVSNARLE